MATNDVAKCQRELIATFDIVPRASGERLRSLWTRPCGEALAVASGLLEDTIRLAEEHSHADLARFRDAVADCRIPAAPSKPRDG
jgi:hypothetical protein